MTSENKHNTIVPLTGKNYATWKLQCRMVLLKEGLWNIVDGTERNPDPKSSETDKDKFQTRVDKALAIIVLSVDPSQLYLLGEPSDPVVVWKKLSDQFQKKSWVNKLELRKKLYALKLKDGDSVTEHIKSMTEIFNELSVIGSPINDEDRVVHLLASLPESFSMLVTALQSNAVVPDMEVVTERLLHEESKINEKSVSDDKQENALSVRSKRFNKNKLTCHLCGKVGHIKKNCWNLKRPKEKANFSQYRKREDSSSSSSSAGFIACHALNASVTVSKDDWIADSGATSHMCSDEQFFSDLHQLSNPEKVKLGDGRLVEATHSGTVILMMKLPDGVNKRCKLSNVLFVPELCYNLLSISKATKFGYDLLFSGNNCKIFNRKNKLICVCSKINDLYFVQYNNIFKKTDACNLVENNNNVKLWHRRFGHLGYTNLKKLSDDKLVSNFKLIGDKKLDICESCIEGKHKRKKFPTNKERYSKGVLELVHSDVCGKMNTKSLNNGEYFLTFIDDYSRYVWVYILKTKDEVFSKFVEWKNEVENLTGKRLKIFRSDNGGEYTSKVFSDYLKQEGVIHQRTIPKTPEQNGVSERFNRTLVETTRCMLQGAKLPQKFWAEALSTAAYLRNRSPAKATQFKTPYEVFNGSKPDVGNLRIFGCISYAHVPKDERAKLDSKARKCVFLGYGKNTKGYRLFDLSKEKVIFSRDTVFDELKFIDEDFEEDDSGSNDRIVYQGYTMNIDEEESDLQHSADNSKEPNSVESVRRSSRISRPPNRYGEQVHSALCEPNCHEPSSVAEAMRGKCSHQWEKAMQKEINSISEHDVWELVKLPPNRKVINCKWVFKEKLDADGSVQTHKARLVAQGFLQQRGLDYDETFSPVVKFESVRTIIAISAENNFLLHQMDVTSAFLNGFLDEEIYMTQPEGFVVKGQENLVCKLKKSLYGLKQAPRCWNTSIDGHLKKLGFAQTVSDPCIYIKSFPETIIIGVYVDDIIIACKSDKIMNDIKKNISRAYSVKDLGPLNYFLGVNIVQDAEKVFIGQQTYARNVLKKFDMENCKHISTPVDTSLKLVSASDDSQCVDQKLYQSAVGSLLYLSIKTRPDITFAVSNVSRFCSRPTEQHWKAVVRIFKYLKGTIDYGLNYVKMSYSCISGYSDADWAGDVNDRKSTSGYIFLKSGAAITWSSRKQSCVALSTAEAEYVALSSATQEAVWLRQLISELVASSDEPTVIYEDNQSAIAISKNPKYHGRTKHIDIKFHYVRDQVAHKSVKLMYCPSENMVADLFTKGLAENQFVKLRILAGVGQP